MCELYLNGFIMQIDNDNYYKGVDGENWYLENKIEMAWRDENYVDCCADMDYIKKYIDESKRKNIRYRILLCETEKKLPLLENIELTEFCELGYDYAYTGGSFYSCIVNDILSKRISEMSQIKLNKFGLFNTFNEAKEFVKLRNSLIEIYPKYTFEGGEFSIYRLKILSSLP
jgi:hypothetical protein